MGKSINSRDCAINNVGAIGMEWNMLGDNII